MKRMPSWSRSVSAWAEYLEDTDQSVDEAIEKTSSESVAEWLEENKWRIVSRLNSVEMEAVSSAEILTDEEVETIVEEVAVTEATLPTPNEPDSDGSSSAPQSGTKV